MLDGLVDPVIVVDERLAVTGANAAAAKFFGEPVEQLLGRACLDWVHEPDRIDATERLARVFAGRPSRPVSLRLVTGRGTLVRVELTGGRFTLEDGSSRVAFTVRDVSWRLAREHDWLRSLGRSHLLAELAIQFQGVEADGFPGALSAALAEIGSSAGASVVVVHETESDGTTLVVRSRWGSPGVEAAAAISGTLVRFPDAPRWAAALSAGNSAIDLSHADPTIAGELRHIDPALRVGVSAALRPSEALLGVLSIGWDEDHRITQEERDLATSAARVLGTALERVRSRQALVESEALFRDLFHRSSAVMYLVDPATLRLVDANAAAAEFYGYTPDEMAGLELHRLTVHTAEELARNVERFRADGTTTIIEEQQVAADGTVRNVEIHSTPMRLADREFDLAIVQDLTEQRRALEDLERLASTDDLTGALNRRRFLEILTDEIARAERYGRPLSLLLLDLDHFKIINDTRGHLAGDAVLAAFATMCQGTIRANDRFARLGGEEFGVLLPETGIAEARLLAERIRTSAAETDVTVSVGVVEWTPGTTVEELYAGADKRLYEAKVAGRNQVVG